MTISVRDDLIAWGCLRPGRGDGLAAVHAPVGVAVLRLDDVGHRHAQRHIAEYRANERRYQYMSHNEVLDGFISRKR
jgi:hypothetical protein